MSFAWTDQQRLSVEWEPDVPRIASPRARRKFFEAYTRERHTFMTDLATMLGGAVIVADVSSASLDGFEIIEPRARH